MESLKARLIAEACMPQVEPSISNQSGKFKTGGKSIASITTDGVRGEGGLENNLKIDWRRKH